MSGHSKWSQIKHKKAIEDAKRSRYFSKLAAAITIAAKDGSDPEKNPRLRLAIDKAKEFNMPKENIERAIKRGSGELEGAKLEEIIFESYGPEGIGILIKAITDNKNRTTAEVKKILSDFNLKLAAQGSVSFQFNEKVIFTIPKSSYSENLELELIETGIEDIEDSKEEVFLTAPAKLFSEIKTILEKNNIKILNNEFSLEPKTKQEVSSSTKEILEKIFEALDQQNEVEGIYSTLKN